MHITYYFYFILNHKYRKVISKILRSNRREVENYYKIYKKICEKTNKYFEEINSVVKKLKDREFVKSVNEKGRLAYDNVIYINLLIYLLSKIGYKRSLSNSMVSMG